MKKLSPESSLIIFILIWRFFLFFIAVVANILIPKFGERFPYYKESLESSGLPNWLWGFGNFDGVHYLRIASLGYSSQYTQSFFPLFPLIIKLATYKDLYVIVGLIISLIFSLLAIVVLFKLFSLDYSKEVALLSVSIYILFPTSFYLISIYSESLFLFLSVLSIYSLRKQKFVLSGILAALSSSTRVVGIFLSMFILLELILYIRNKKIQKSELINRLIGLIIAPFGLLSYMIYLQVKFNDALYFLHALPNFGTGRSSSDFTLLPQVFFRYLKIITSIPINSYNFFIAFLELFLTTFFLFFLIYSFKKIRFSYWLFTFGCFILPTLTGTLTSMPRYLLMCFLLFPLIYLKFKKFIYLYVFVSMILQILLVGLFIRGYWVA